MRKNLLGVVTVYVVQTLLAKACLLFFQFAMTPSTQIVTLYNNGKKQILGIDYYFTLWNKTTGINSVFLSG